MTLNMTAIHWHVKCQHLSNPNPLTIASSFLLKYKPAQKLVVVDTEFNLWIDRLTMASFGLNILKAYNSDSDTGESCDEGVNDSEGTTATSVSSSSPQLKNNVIISSRKRGDMKEDSILLQSVKRRRTDASGQHEICSNATSLPNSFSNNNNNNDCTTGEPEGEKDDPGLVRRLPSVPSHILQMFPDETATRQDDDPSLHLGRVRTFPHVRGNWATYIYIQRK